MSDPISTELLAPELVCSCMACENPEAAGDFVQCNTCNSWWHFMCAGVTRAIAERPWFCPLCTTVPNVSPVNVGSRHNARELARNLAELRARHEREKKRLELELQRQFLDEQQRLLDISADEDAHSVMSEVTRAMDDWRLVDDDEEEEEGAVGGVLNPPAASQLQPPAIPCDPTAAQMIKDLQDQLARYQRESIPAQNRINELTQQVELCRREIENLRRPSPRVVPATRAASDRMSSLQPAGRSQTYDHRSNGPQYSGYRTQRSLGAVPRVYLNQAEDDSAPEVADRSVPARASTGRVYADQQRNPFARSANVNTPRPAINPMRNQLHSGIRNLMPAHYGPTQQQLAARQSLGRDLPAFSGNPADWPIFISNFEYTTEACGFTDGENMLRLQRCLKGAALETVRSRLVLPGAVPQVIETLRMRYGRPELLINALLEKVRSIPAPRSDRLEGLIEFGMAVQSLCDHIEAANEHDHLSNPTLLQELVSKLPADQKLMWAGYKRGVPIVNLKTFTEYMMEIVQDASSVVLFEPETRKAVVKAKPRGFVNSHTTDDPEEATGSAAGVRITKHQGCLVCDEPGHYVKECENFKSLTVDERWRKVRSLGLCQNCLFNHGRRSCRISARCNVDGCQFRHHSLLHSAKQTASTVSTQVAESHTHQQLGSSVLFRIVPVTLYGPKGTVDTFAFLDEGSSLTLVESELASQIGVHGSPQSLCLRWTGNTSRVEHKSQSVSLTVSGHGMKQQYKLHNARTVESLNLPSQSFRLEEATGQLQYLQQFPIKSYQNAVPKLLIGLDNLHLATPLKIKEEAGSELIATKTRLGWCVYGRKQGEIRSGYNYHICECTCDKELQEVVKQFYAIEEAGTKSPEAAMSKEECRAWDLLESTTKRVNGRFETGLLWSKDDFELPRSYEMAVRRLQCLERRMERSPQLKENLHRQIREYQAKGYAHKVTPEELREVDAKKIWFLPVGAVTNPKKPGKVRIVLDAAAKVKGVSLNSFLLKGPDQLTSLLAVFFKFRLFSVAVTADIKEMFHQLLIRLLDKYAQCFLWRAYPTHEPEVYVMDVAIFGATCSPALAQYVKNLNAKEHAAQFPRATEGILKSTYVDDYLDSFGSVEEAKQIAAEVRMINKNGGFDLRNWRSNSAEVLKHMGESGSVENQTINLAGDEQFERVLGMLWNPSTDELSFCTRMNEEARKLIEAEATPTKRQILRCVMSLFDPLGLLSPFVIHGKILMQDLWRAGVGWDEQVGDGAFLRWKRWIEMLDWVATVRIPRCYFSRATMDTYKDAQLHVFVDASSTAYSCAVYLRIVSEDGTPQCTLVAAKAKVAPLKPLSIPRLELQACVLGTRLLKFVESNHSITVTKRVLWTDSQTAYTWIRADPRNYRPFVAHRVGEILETTSASEWRWLQSEDNPADEATKWGSGPYFSNRSQWFSSSRIIYQPEEQWPSPAVPHVDVEDEIRPCVLHHVEVVPVIDYDRFSRWERLRNTMVYVLRFRNNADKRCPKLSGPPSQQEFEAAEGAIVKLVQLETYPDEVTIVDRNRSLSLQERTPIEKSSPLHQLVPFMDDRGILRQNSRIRAAEQAAFGLRYPVILPKHHRVTRLIAEYYHRLYRHAVFETVVNEIRQVYAIAELRSLVRRISRTCLICKLKRSRPAIPPMAPLPPARLASHTRPFSYVGVDYFGPLLVKIGRATAKRWVALFTCLTVRAVHLEIAFDLSTNSCISCVRRFVCRRGSPIEFISDNATNFRGADRILREQINRGLSITFTNTNTRWSFIPPGAPHMGGAWERLVRSVKLAMDDAYSDGKLDDEGLQTLVSEVESMVNARPLTYLPLESEESESLTPNHFLIGSSTGNKVPAIGMRDAIQDAQHLKGTYELMQRQLNRFWIRWTKEYLPVIRRQKKWFVETRPVRVGDLVLMVDDEKRNGWIRGRIHGVKEGLDGRIREATVKTSNGILRRPVSKLALLDVGEGSAVSVNTEMHPGEDVPDRPDELAALHADGNPTSVSGDNLICHDKRE